MKLGAVLKYPALTLAFASLASGSIIAAGMDSFDTIGYRIFWMLIPLTALFLALVAVNLRFAVPRLLLRDRLPAYCLCMLFLSYLLPLAALGMEYVLRRWMALPPRITSWESPWILVDTFCNSILLFLIMAGLGFIGVLFIFWGDIYPTVIVALSVYAMFPVLKNTYTGILGVEERYLEAARGCGMSPFQTLIRVELPLAMPIIIAGLRMAAIYTVSWAVLASMIGLGGLGDFVYRGTSSNNNTLILLGAIPAAVLAILFGVLIDLLQKKVTPRGLWKEAGR